MTNDISLLSFFTNQDWFPPRCALSFITWHSKGVSKLSDAIDKKVILTKGQLEERLGESIPWFTYLQLHSLFQISKIQASIQKGKTDFENLLEAIQGAKGLISRIYRILLNREDSRDD